MDDGNGVSSSLPPGSRLIDGRVKVVEEEIEGDNTIPADIRTSDIILEIANTISPFIDLTVDSPSPLHRPRSWDQSGRRKKKLLTKTS